MALVVEDGTGKSDADAYDSVANVDTYVTNFAQPAATTAWGLLTTAQKEKAIRQATQYLDHEFGSRWKGVRTTEDQALDWPRYSAVDRDGYTIDSDVVPKAVREAMAEMAVRASTEDLQPDGDTLGSVKRTRDKVGPLETEVEYAGAVGNLNQKDYEKADRMLAELLVGGGSASVVEVERA